MTSKFNQQRAIHKYDAANRNQLFLVLSLMFASTPSLYVNFSNEHALVMVAAITCGAKWVKIPSVQVKMLVFTLLIKNRPIYLKIKDSID